VEERLTGLIKQFWPESGGIYDYRKIYSDLREVGKRCGKNRVYRLLKAVELRAQVCYRRHPAKAGTISVLAPNRLQQQLSLERPNEACVRDITHIRTHRAGFSWRLLSIFTRAGSWAGPCNRGSQGNWR